MLKEVLTTHTTQLSQQLAQQIGHPGGPQRLPLHHPFLPDGVRGAWLATPCQHHSQPGETHNYPPPPQPLLPLMTTPVQGTPPCHVQLAQWPMSTLPGMSCNAPPADEPGTNENHAPLMPSDFDRPQEEQLGDPLPPTSSSSRTSTTSHCLCQCWQLEEAWCYTGSRFSGPGHCSGNQAGTRSLGRAGHPHAAAGLHGQSQPIFDDR